MKKRPEVHALEVSVVAANAETTDGLHDYLSEAGVRTQTASTLSDACVLSGAASAVVVFPDGLDVDEVARQIASLRSARPRLLIVVVTNLAHRYGPVLEPDGESFPPIVLSRPAFGWSILDAIREYAERGTA